MKFSWQSAVAAAVFCMTAAAQAAPAAPSATAPVAAAAPAAAPAAPAATPTADKPAPAAKAMTCPKGQHAYRGSCVKNHKKKKATAPAATK